MKIWLACAVLLASLGASAAVPVFVKAVAGACSGGTTPSGTDTVSCNAGLSLVHQFTVTPTTTGDGVLIAVGCSATLSTTSVGLTATGWTFTQIGSLIGNTTAGWMGLFRAFAPNTSAATISATWVSSATNCNGFAFNLVQEWTNMDATTVVDTASTPFPATLNAGGSGCTTNITPSVADTAIVGFCEDSTTAVGSGYTVGGDDGAQDWGEWKVLTGGSGVLQTVNFGSTGSANEFAVAVKGIASSATTPTRSLMGVGK